MSVILLPILLNLIAIVLGILSGFILNKLVNSKRSQDNRLVVTITLILTMTGFCSAFNISPLLSCMAFGATYINISRNKELFRQMNNFTPPILIMFFVLSGMRLNVPSLLTAGIIGIVYFIVRITGKFTGVYIGAIISRSSVEIRRYFAMALIPQASVSIGLALLGQRILPEEMGSLLSTIILSSSVLYEMIGPVSAKNALHLSKSIPEDAKSDLVLQSGSEDSLIQALVNELTTEQSNM
jgi:Kef-type K+ transport system membrane component KefB